jgi:biopolymer transport protein ExbD
MDGFVTEDQGEVMNEINMIPFIDIMLVLLIIFIITVPVMRHSVNVALPQASSEPEVVKPQTLQLAVRADGGYVLDGAPVSSAELAERLREDALKTPQPDLHISGDRSVPYGRVALAMVEAQQAGLSKIGFVMEPVAGGPAAK